jgi:hypothetical protein
MRTTSLIALTVAAFVALGDIPSVYAEEEEEIDAEVYEEEEEYDDEDYEDDEDEYTMMYAPSPDVTTSLLFPDYPDNRLPLGEEVTALISLNNAGDKTLNVSYVGAQLHSPYDLSYYIHNYTAKEIWTAVLPQSEVSIEYQFTTPDNLEPLDFWLSGYVFYNSTDNMYAYRSTWTNDTITFTPAATKFDAETLATYLIILAAFLGIVYWILGLTGTQKAVMKQLANSAKAAKGAQAKPSVDDWNTPVYKQAAAGRKAGGRRSKGKKKAE